MTQCALFTGLWLAPILVNREDSNIVKNGFAQRAMREVCLVDHLGQHDIHIITRPD